MELLISPCTQLLTLAGPSSARRGRQQSELGLLSDGAVLIENSTIKIAGPRAEIEQAVGAREITRINAENCVVLPGFVDSHAHPVFAASREREFEQLIQGMSYPEIAEAGGGILSSVRAVRSATLNDLVKTAIPRLSSILRHGTTTLEAKSGYGLDLENEIKMLESIQRLSKMTPLELVPTFLGAHEIPPEHKQHPARYREELTEKIIPEIARRKLAEYCDCFVEPHLFDLAAATALLQTAATHGLKPRLHADQLTRSGAAQLGARLGAISVDHLEQIEEEDIQILSRSHTIATLLPGSVYHLGLHRYPPARRLIDTGVPVALATDFNPGSSPTLSMQMVLSLACTQMRMTPAEAIVAATFNGACALERENRLGSLEPGKQADLCIMDVPDYRQIPYYFGVNHCRQVIKAGEIVYSSDY
jgi:imidazolonepropionase